jgi:hypothetical protein
MSNAAFMTRGLGQVLFNYLPDATLDYDRGSCICKVAEVIIDTSIEEKIDKLLLLREIRTYVDRWEGRSNIPAENTHRPGLFAFGTPEKVIFNIYPLTFECRNCRAAFSYNREEEFLSNPENHKCRWCGGRLNQIYHVLVHECGNIKSLWVPKCPNHGNNPSRVKLDFQGSQKARDFRWVCTDCNQELRTISRPCEICSAAEQKVEGGESSRGKRPTMRPIPHRANAAYYTHHITRVNVGTQDLRELESHPEREQILVDAYLHDSYGAAELISRTTSRRDPKREKAEELRQMASTMPDGPRRKSLLEAADTIEALSNEPSEDAHKQTGYAISEGAFRELLEYVKFRSTCRISGTTEVRQEFDRRRPGMGAIFDLIENEYENAGIAEIKLVADFPVLTAVFGYTRVSFEPETSVGGDTIQTTFNWFPTLRMNKEALVDKIPIFIRAAETEAIFVRLNPIRLLSWLAKILPGSVVEAPLSESLARLWLLRNVDEVDRFVTQNQMRLITREIFGIIHTLSHIFIRSAASLAGIDRTGLAEYLFPRIGAFVIYNSNTVFNLGGLTTMFEENLEELLRNTRSNPLAQECVYDPVCKEQWNSSCHACMHLGEMACSFFNRGMSREFLFGPKGYWAK